jgi:hypothetical protein
MKTTTINYTSRIKSVDIKSLPKKLQDGHEFFSEYGEFYDEDTDIAKAIDAYFRLLDEHLDTKKPVKSAKDHKKRLNEKKKKLNQKAKVKAENEEKSKAEKKVEKKKASKPKKEKAVKPTKEKKIKAKKPTVAIVDTEDVKFIRRLKGFQGKTKTKEQVRQFITALQKAILDKKIRKNSVYAKEIARIQQVMVDVYNDMDATYTFDFENGTKVVMNQITEGKRYANPVDLIRKFLALEGKKGMESRAKSLLSQIEKSIDGGAISNSDAYFDELMTIKRLLKKHIESGKPMEMAQAELRGLQGICGLRKKKAQVALGSLETPGHPVKSTDAVPAADVLTMQFDQLDFTGDWLELLGQPEPNFACVIYSPPGEGKSTFSIRFANYLATNFGKVVFVSNEEGISQTLKQKIALVPERISSRFLISAWTDFATLKQKLAKSDAAFVFIDSLDNAGLTAHHLKELRQLCPAKAFITISQVTKDGKFRGSNELAHDCDIVIEIVNGTATTRKNRYKQKGAEMGVFGEN